MERPFNGFLAASSAQSGMFVRVLANAAQRPAPRMPVPKEMRPGQLMRRPSSLITWRLCTIMYIISLTAEVQREVEAWGPQRESQLQTVVV